MLNEVDLTKKMDKETYKGIIEGLELKLAELQRKAKEMKIPILIVFEGWGAAGKGTFINELILPLDPRGFTVHTTNTYNEEERLRPFLWRFWIRTPAKGRIEIFDKSWYRKTMVERIDESIDGKELAHVFEDIKAFEKQLAEDGNVIIKFFLHISKKEQKDRFKKLEANPATKWRVTKEDWKHNEQYEKYTKVIDEMIERTNTAYAPWTVVPSHDKRHTVVQVFNTVIDAIESKIEVIEKQKIEKSRITLLPNKIEERPSTILSGINLDKDFSKEVYKEKLKAYQSRLREIEHQIYTRRIPVIILYEGWDAAGKGGNIKRLTQNMDPRGYQVLPFAAPTQEELAHHYLWRFWKGIPKAGHIGVFDRTWYGRVMVERIEGFCSEMEWKRAYGEINEMEKHIVNFGAVVIKFWLHIDKEEQLKRFTQRQNDPTKQWKITDEDWRNREKWDSYEVAVSEMIEKTSTEHAPWTIVESNSKQYSRLKTLSTIIESVEKKL